MANRNNLIHPPRLQGNENAEMVPPHPPPNPPNPNPPQPNANIPLDNLALLVSRLVIETLRTEGRHIINEIINPVGDINNDVDIPVNVNNEGNLSDMDKVPDIVKSLRDFSGKPGEFSSWKKSVERILAIYEHLKGTPKYYGILSVIRNKIVGEADTALESYNTPLNWDKIAKCLTLHYADRRDVGTLEYQMTTLVQGNSSIHEFYQNVYHHLSLILNKLSCMDMGPESLQNMTQSYRSKALDTFVRGLNGDLPTLLSISGPTDLPQALQLCQKLQNVNYRTQHAHGSQSTMRKNFFQTPPLPPKRNNHPLPQHQVNRYPKREFYPALLHDPQPSQIPQFTARQQPQGPQVVRPNVPQYPNYWQLPPKPRRYEPMDVDQSIRSRAVNYQNRPNVGRQFPVKRESGQQPDFKNKQQRNYHTQAFNIMPEVLEETMYHNSVSSDEALREYLSLEETVPFPPPEAFQDTAPLEVPNEDELEEGEIVQHPFLD